MYKTSIIIAVALLFCYRLGSDNEGEIQSEIDILKHSYDSVEYLPDGPYGGWYMEVHNGG